MDETDRESGSTYVCAMCCETFNYGWSENEAAEEREANFPGLTPETAAMVCDDCFRKLPITHWAAQWREDGDDGITPEVWEELEQYEDD